MKLSVNIDHIATLRNARGEQYPSVAAAAALAELAGAHGTTLHIRGDRRHVNETDLMAIKSVVTNKITLEMAVTDEMREIALRLKPHQVTLVPESPREVTTEGGLALTENIAEYIKPLKDEGIAISLFLDPKAESMGRAYELGAEIVELHTGSYAKAWEQRDEELIDDELTKISEAVITAVDTGLIIHAGHGLHYQNLPPICQIEEIDELSIGHSIVARAIFLGWDQAVREILQLIR